MANLVRSSPSLCSRASALCLFSGVGLSAHFKPFLIAASDLKLLSRISAVISLQGKSLKSTIDIYVVSMFFFFIFLFKASPPNHFSWSKKHHPTPGVAFAILMFERRPSRCLFALRLISSCERDGVKAGGFWLLLNHPCPARRVRPGTSIAQQCFWHRPPQDIPAGCPKLQMLVWRRAEQG